MPSCVRISRKYWSRLPNSNSASSRLSSVMVTSLIFGSGVELRVGYPIDTRSTRRVHSPAHPAIGKGRSEDDGIDHVKHTAEAGDNLRGVLAPAIALD